MKKEDLLSKAAEYAALFTAAVFAPEKSEVLGKVGDDLSIAVLGQVTEPGRYLVASASDSQVKTEKGAVINSIRWNLMSEAGVPCSIYNGTLTRGVAAKSAAKAGLLGTYGKSKEILIGKAISVTEIERGEADANNRRPILKLNYTVEEF